MASSSPLGYLSAISRLPLGSLSPDLQPGAVVVWRRANHSRRVVAADGGELAAAQPDLLHGRRCEETPAEGRAALAAIRAIGSPLPQAGRRKE